MRIGVLGSGNGSNFQAIVDAIEAGSLTNVEVGIVLSDVVDSKILDRAKKHGIPSQYIPPGTFKTKLDPETEEKYIQVLKDHGVELVVLAGFMRVIKSKMLHAFPYSILNVHPSLLPSFKGLEAWKQALDYGVKVTGCTVHIVNMDIDRGPIILQANVPVNDDDTPESLHARIQEQEHRIFPEALQLFADDKIHLRGRRISLKESEKAK